MGDEIRLWRMVHPFDSVKIAILQFQTEEVWNRVGAVFSVIMNAFGGREDKTCLAVEIYVSFYTNGPEAHPACFIQGIIEQCQSIALALVLRSDTDRSEGQNRDMPAVIGEYLSAAEYYLAYDIAVEFHYEVQLRDEVRMIPQMVKYIMLGAAWLIDIPKGFSTEIFNCSVICFRLRTDCVILIHCFMVL